MENENTLNAVYSVKGLGDEHIMISLISGKYVRGTQRICSSVYPFLPDIYLASKKKEHKSIFCKITNVQCDNSKLVLLLIYLSEQFWNKHIDADTNLFGLK